MSQEKKYDIFISYRRTDTGQRAEHLKDLLDNDYKDRISFDRENLAGLFDVELARRIDTCVDFLLLIDEKSLVYTEKDNSDENICLYNYLATASIGDFEAKINELGPDYPLDFVRIEIARALHRRDANIIPIVPETSDKFNFAKLYLPKDIVGLKRYDAIFFSKNKDSLFKDILNKLRHHLKTPKTTKKVISAVDSVVYKIRVDRKCTLFIDDEYFQDIEANKLTKISLPKGEYLRKVVDIEDENVYAETEIQLIEGSKLDDVQLNDLFQAAEKRRKAELSRRLEQAMREALPEGEFQVGDLMYKASEDSGGVTVCKPIKLETTEIHIPSQVRYGNYTYDVDCIGDSAFYDCSGLTSITIPNTVTSIGDYAFNHCSSLTSITIPNSVTSIGESAFYECSSLAWVTIPNSVTSIGVVAFAGCSSLTSITIPNSVTSIGESAFWGCSGLTSIIVEKGNDTYDSRKNCNAIIETASNTLIVSCKNTKIPNSVTSIGDSAFYDCSGLTSITIPNSVTSIGNHAFDGSSALTSISIPNTVTSIGEYAFSRCSSLISITIPNSVMSIGDYVFYNCSGLTSITIPKSITSIGNHAFEDCECLTSITIPNSVTSIGERAFAFCFGLTSITLPNTVTSIGESAFYGCSSLTSITIPNSVTSIGDWAFYNCSGLTSITIPNSVTSIGRSAIALCSVLTSIKVEKGNRTYDSRRNCNAIIETASNTLIAGCKNTTIPNSVTSIGDEALEGCYGLTSITIPNSVTNIGERAFYCSHLTSIIIPNSVTSIGEGAFYVPFGLTSIIVKEGNKVYDSRENCNAIIETASNTLICGCKNTTIPNSVTSIGEGAFKYCSGLTAITIPNSVKSIGDKAFKGCKGLTLHTIPNSVTSIGEAAFADCKGLTSITIPDSVTSIGKDAFWGCSGLTTITIPNSVTSIGKGAFEWCSALMSVKIPKSLTEIGEDAFPEHTKVIRE